MKTTRREFTKLFTGGLLGIISPLSVFGKDKQKLIYAKDIRIDGVLPDSIKVNEIPAKDIEGCIISGNDIKADTIPSEEKCSNHTHDVSLSNEKYKHSHALYEEDNQKEVK